jgi:hypothetical protein
VTGHLWLTCGALLITGSHAVSVPVAASSGVANAAHALRIQNVSLVPGNPSPGDEVDVDAQVVNISPIQQRISAIALVESPDARMTIALTEPAPPVDVLPNATLRVQRRYIVRASGLYSLTVAARTDRAYIAQSEIFHVGPQEVSVLGIHPGALAGDGWAVWIAISGLGGIGLLFGMMTCSLLWLRWEAARHPAIAADGVEHFEAALVNSMILAATVTAFGATGAFATEIAVLNLPVPDQVAAIADYFRGHLLDIFIGFGLTRALWILVGGLGARRWAQALAVAGGLSVSSLWGVFATARNPGPFLRTIPYWSLLLVALCASFGLLIGGFGLPQAPGAARRWREASGRGLRAEAAGLLGIFDAHRRILAVCRRATGKVAGDDIREPSSWDADDIEPVFDDGSQHDRTEPGEGSATPMGRHRPNPVQGRPARMARRLSLAAESRLCTYGVGIVVGFLGGLIATAWSSDRRDTDDVPHSPTLG